MANSNIALDQLRGFLDQFFQLDVQDLDFGMCKILHYKRKEIAKFIDQLLVNKVKEQLQTLSDDEVKQVKTQLEEMEKSGALKKRLEAVQRNDETYEKDYKGDINGKKYHFIIGHDNTNRQIDLIWRSAKDAYTYHPLYINDQAHREGYRPIEEVFKNKMLA